MNQTSIDRLKKARTDLSKALGGDPEESEEKIELEEESGEESKLEVEAEAEAGANSWGFGVLFPIAGNNSNIGVTIHLNLRNESVRTLCGCCDSIVTTHVGVHVGI